jgi:serine/threonine-protein kinase
MAVAAGAKLGPYEILAPLGAGGMGEVYKARDIRLDRTVAIKLSHEKFSERFEREARAVAALNHPNICQLYDVGPNYLVMEYIDGAPLKGPLPLEQVMKYAGQICDALDAAHKKGITHRDLKPANILVTKAGVKLLDFGLARIATSPDETMTMAVMGTPAYMAPEQWEGKPGDARSDIYAFGCVLYEMLTGKRASAERVAVEPAALEQVLRTCLEKDPDARWQSAHDVKRALELAGQVSTVPAPSARGYHWVGWIAAALVSVGAVLLMVQGPRSAGQPTAQSPVHLDLDLGPDVSLAAAFGPAVIISPDGTRLVFVSEGADGMRRLFTRRLDQGKPTPLVKTEGAYGPFFSPDGQWVGFFAQGKLKKTRIDGGEPVSLCDAPAGRGASWGDDGNIIAALDTQSGLSQVAQEGGRPLRLTELSLGDESHRWPQVLPGGKTVLFTAGGQYGNYDEADVVALFLKDRHRKIVLEQAGMYPHYLVSGHLVYVTKGTLFAAPFDPDRVEVRGTPASLQEVSADPSIAFAEVAFSRNGTMAYGSGRTGGLRTVQWLDGAGKTESIASEPASYYFLHLSPDGNRLVLLMNQGSSSDLWVYDLQRGNRTRLTSGTRLTSWPVWSPDGRYVVFGSAGGMLWTRSDGSGSPQPLTQSKRKQFPNSFRPDGTQLAYSELTPDGTAELRTVRVENQSGQLRAGESQFFLTTSTANTHAAFSPDGRWLAYSDAEAGSYEVYVRAFPDNGTKVPISNAGGLGSAWSRNAHELFYRTEDQKIMAARYTVQQGAFVPDKPRVWSGKPLANVGTAPNFDLAPDGKRVIALMPAEGPEPTQRQNHVMLVVNFFDELRRRTAAQGK